MEWSERARKIRPKLTNEAIKNEAQRNVYCAGSQVRIWILTEQRSFADRQMTGGHTHTHTIKYTHTHTTRNSLNSRSHSNT